MTDIPEHVKRCTTHHSACDCIDYFTNKRIADLEQQLSELEQQLSELRDGINRAGAYLSQGCINAAIGELAALLKQEG